MRWSLEVLPLFSRFSPGQRLEFQLRLSGGSTKNAVPESDIRIRVLENGTEVSACTVSIGSDGILSIANPVRDEGKTAVRGFFLRADTVVEDVQIEGTTAFDVAAPGAGAVRYGFLTRFGPDDANSEVVSRAPAYHLTHLQFYDWMYRHEKLVSPDDRYRDPLDRPMSRGEVQSRIAQCHDHGIRAVAYGAVYGAGREFADHHPGWSLYRRNGDRHSLADWLCIMNVASGCGWRDHLVEQYKEARDEIGFDGFHMDTYGYPKHALDQQGNLVRLEAEFLTLIDDVRDALDAEGSTRTFLVFNAVNNWPSRELAGAQVDATYIEVWSPNAWYVDLWRLVREARLLSSRPVILAAYLRPFLPEKITGWDAEIAAVGSLLYATAVICSSGGTHLILGEGDGVLCDPYYVNHGVLPPWSRPIVRRYYDFLTAYGPLLLADESCDLTLDHAHGPDDEFRFDGAPCSAKPVPGRLWAVIRETRYHFVVSLVNLTELTSGEWNEPHNPPTRHVEGLSVTILTAEPLSRCYTDTPDAFDLGWTHVHAAAEEGRELTLEEVTTARGPAYRVDVPPVGLWRLLVFDR